MQKLLSWFTLQDFRTKSIIIGIGSLVMALVIWIAIRSIGKTMPKGKNFKDPSDKGSPFQNQSNDAQIFANNLGSWLENSRSWYGCNDAENMCQTLASFSKSSQDWIKSVGRAYNTGNSKPLSQAIQDNPCVCEKYCLVCGKSIFSKTDKSALISTLKNFGY